MRALSLSLLPRIGVRWLVWLALLLPVAQYAAAVHGISHLSRAGQAGDPDRQAPGQPHCDLCLSAADLAGAAAPGVPPGPPPADLRHGRPAFAGFCDWAVPLALAYASRAPPFLLS